MQVFQESLKDSEFLKNLELAKDKYENVEFNDEDFNYVKNRLECAFAIFPRSEQLEPFSLDVRE